MKRGAMNKSAMDITPFRNILNEMYAANVSMKVEIRLSCVKGNIRGYGADF